MGREYMKKPMVRLFSVILLALMISSCGFKPMYGKFSDDSNLRDIMANIRIDEVREDGRKTRLGMVIRNGLLDRITPYGETAAPDYSLTVTFKVIESGYGIREDESVTLQNLKLVASYQLFDLLNAANGPEAGQKPILDSAARAIVTYDLIQSNYSNMAARQAAIERLSDEVSNQIATRVGAFLSQRNNKRNNKSHKNTAAANESPS